MVSYQIRIGDRRMIVPADAIDRLRDDLRVSVRAGGDLVEVPTRPRPTEILISPGVLVVIEQLAEVDGDDPATATTPHAQDTGSSEFDDWGD